MNDITQITVEQDKNDRDILLEALGTENNPTQWLNFMDAVMSVLSVVLRRGRSSKQDIEQSLIGRLGFTSWRQMIETPVSENGLAWNWSGWVAWRRAYKIVQEYDYLRTLELTANAVVVLDQEAKKDEIEFPADLEEFEAWRKARDDDKSKKQAQTISKLKKQLEDELYYHAKYKERSERYFQMISDRNDELHRISKLSRFQIFKCFFKGKIQLSSTYFLLPLNKKADS